MSEHESAPLHGAMFSTAATLGHAESNTLGPTAGNGFRNRWVDDLAHLSEHGISTVRVTLDWSRLLPRPGSIDAGWVEFYGSLLDASRALGSQTWVCLHEAGVPKWFDNEGGFGDDDAAAKWWPRWVEAAAEHFGDRVAGWIPFLTPPSSVASVWSDTWSIVGGNTPVVRSFRLPDDRDSLPDDDAEATHLGLSLIGVDDDRSSDHHDSAFEAERIGTLIRDLAEHSAALPIVVTNAEHPQRDHDDLGAALEALDAALADAVSDGVRIDAAFLAEAVDGTDSLGLFKPDGTPTTAATTWIPIA